MVKVPSRTVRVGACGAGGDFLSNLLQTLTNGTTWLRGLFTTVASALVWLIATVGAAVLGLTVLLGPDNALVKYLSGNAVAARLTALGTDPVTAIFVFILLVVTALIADWGISRFKPDISA